jgi:hypothetical protein
METRVGRMLAWFAARQKAITDFLPGSVTRTRYEAIALELEQQDYQTYRAVTKAIPIAVYRAFNFAPLPAVRAGNMVTLSIAVAAGQDIVIPKGSQVTTVASTTTPVKTYETTAAATLLAGQTTVAAAVVCTSPGSTGNTGAGTITVVKGILGIDAVTNASALTNGADAESEADRVRRFQGYITTLAKGTDGALEYGAKTAVLTDESGAITERVTQALAVDIPAATAGFADVYIYNGIGDTSSELITRAQAIVNGYTDSNGVKIIGYKAAGVVVTVSAATEIAQDITLVITLLPGAIAADIIAKAEAAIAAYLGSLGIGETIIYHELVERMMTIDGVYDVVITAPAANVLAQVISAADFTGSGLDDMTAGGTFTGTGRRTYIVQVDGTGATDTVKWSRDNGATWASSEVLMIAATPIELELGLTVTFAAATGHTLTDRWTVVASAAVVFKPGDVDITVQ